MLTLTAKIEHAESIFAQLVLPYELRENSRLRTALVAAFEAPILWRLLKAFSARHGFQSDVDKWSDDHAFRTGAVPKYLATT